jgi:hypothetical protein
MEMETECPKIRRLRTSETTLKAKVTPQAQPISKNGRVAIRLHFFVGRPYTTEHWL